MWLVLQVLIAKPSLIDIIYAYRPTSSKTTTTTKSTSGTSKVFGALTGPLRDLTQGNVPGLVQDAVNPVGGIANNLFGR